MAISVRRAPRAQAESSSASGLRGVEASDEEILKAVQSTVLEMALCVDRICRQEGLRYSLAFGSFIGAVRHKGFIPWDDDVDVLMPRPDYERFVDAAPRLLPDFYELQNFRASGALHYVTRVSDTRTLMRLGSYEQGNEKPVWLDVFVLDGIPEGALARRAHYARIQWHKAMCAFSAFDRTVNLSRPGRPLWQQVIIRFCHATHFGSWMDPYDRLEKYDRALKRYPFGDGPTCVCGVGSYGPERQTWPTAAFENLAEYEFEGARLFAPRDHAAVLGVTYGDYMELPPEDKRTVHRIELLRHPWFDKATPLSAPLSGY